MSKSAASSVGPTGASSETPLKQKVTFEDDGIKLTGFIYKPSGPGPFPAIVWNHGSEAEPAGPKSASTLEKEFDAVAAPFVAAGYVVMAPERRGHGESGGPSMNAEVEQMLRSKGIAAGERFMVDQLAGPQLDDQLAGLSYLKSQPFVATDRLAVVGCSYGGIETILGAERGAGYRVAVAISPGAESWKGNKVLRARLVQAVDGISLPIFLIHPSADASLEPGKVLGAELQKLGKPYKLKIFPANGTNDKHCFNPFGRGVKIWAPDAIDFISRVIKR